MKKLVFLLLILPAISMAGNNTDDLVMTLEYVWNIDDGDNDHDGVFMRVRHRDIELHGGKLRTYQDEMKPIYGIGWVVDSDGSGIGDDRSSQSTFSIGLAWMEHYTYAFSKMAYGSSATSMLDGEISIHLYQNFTREQDSYLYGGFGIRLNTEELVKDVETKPEPTSTTESTETTTISADPVTISEPVSNEGDHDNGHGNDEDGFDESNPGQGGFEGL